MAVERERERGGEGGSDGPGTYHRDRVLEDRGVEMLEEYSFERRHEIGGRAADNSRLQLEEDT